MKTKTTFCEKVILIDEQTGDVYRVPCGRRTCPRCAGLYAYILGSAFELAHQEELTHIVLTVDQDHVKLFPRSGNYLHSRIWQKNMLLNKQDRLNYETVVQSRRKIARGCEISSRAIKDILAVFPNKGFIRSVEFGEKKGRYHIHLAISVDLLVFFEKMGIKMDEVTYIQSEDIYVVNDPRWPFGTMRICGLTHGKGAIAYLTAYATKNTPGRIRVDAKTSEYRRKLKVIRSLMSGFDKKTLSYQASGAKYRAQQALEDRKFVREKKRKKRK